MRYLKLFESMDNNTEIDWAYDVVKQIDVREAERITIERKLSEYDDGVYKNILRILKDSGMNMRPDIQNDILCPNWISYLYDAFSIFFFKNKGTSNLWIIPLKDEYFICCDSNKFYYKCDGYDGLERYLKGQYYPIKYVWL
jgi:hypothetical protein